MMTHDYMAKKLWEYKEAEFQTRKIGRTSWLRRIYANIAVKSSTPTRSIITFKQVDKSTS